MAKNATKALARSSRFSDSARAQFLTTLDDLARSTEAAEEARANAQAERVRLLDAVREQEIIANQANAQISANNAMAEKINALLD